MNCIHPTPSESGFAAAEMLFIDPDACIDCGACLDVCPVGAVVADYDLTEKDEAFRELNARFFQSAEAPRYVARRPDQRLSNDPGGPGKLRVAIVGSGPAGAFAAQYLLDAGVDVPDAGVDVLGAGTDVAIDMFERLPVPWGLVRFGVAPDHPRTKQIADLFERIADDPRFRLVLDTEIGRDVGLSDLTGVYDAVIFATGALSDRKLEIPGEGLPGSCSATEFASWYNGHPDFADRSFNLDTERIVVVGNGNVALDVARVLASDIDVLRRTDIADHALDALAASRVREVVVIGRRGPAQAAFTTPELLGLAASRDFSLQVELPDDCTASDDWIGATKLDILQRLAGRAPTAGRTLRLLFQRSPIEILGDDRVSAIRLVHNRLERKPDGRLVAMASDQQDILDTGFVLRSVGYAGSAIDGLPFDERRGVVPNIGGRVIDPATHDALPGLYVTGWIRRGPSGSMGSNRTCAREAVAALLDDHRAGKLIRGGAASYRLTEAIAQGSGLAHWRAIDGHERAQGRLARRPRVKLVHRSDMARIGGKEALR
ncbi:MAG: FAD-dependent oxidoreductase [Burkholderiaceae bacterium]